MTNPAAKALFDAHWATLKSQRGETVTYHRADDSVELTAVFSRPNAIQVDGEQTAVFESRSYDALIDPAWPAGAPESFNGAEPEHGDKIERSDGSLYYVQPSDAADACWRWADGMRTFRRVFIEER